MGIAGRKEIKKKKTCHFNLSRCGRYRWWEAGRKASLVFNKNAPPISYILYRLFGADLFLASLSLFPSYTATRRQPLISTEPDR